jgi:DNA-binding CsgD family transcriptional regulator
MDDGERRLGHWVDLVDHLLRCPGPAFPHAWVREELASTFGTNASWNWVDADYNCGFEMLEQPAGWPSPEEHEMWVHEAMREHPLMRWFLRTGSAAAMTVGRVPSQVASRRGLDLLAEFMRPVGLDQQLVIPYELQGAEQRTFVLADSGVDYSDAQLDLARRIQPLLVVLSRQYAVIDGEAAAATETAGLTGRELAVLRLLAEGLTAQAIGRRLGVSPLTVRKHLENTYRKLGVPDRMLAVLQAQRLGLVRATRRPTTVAAPTQHLTPS